MASFEKFSLQDQWGELVRGGYTLWCKTSDFRCPTAYERSGDSVCAPKYPETIPYHAYTYYGTPVKILKRLELFVRSYRPFTKGGDTQF